MNDLSRIVDELRAQLETKNDIRDLTLRRSRELIRECALSVRAAHRHDFAEAEELLRSAREAARDMVDDLSSHPDLYYTGYTQDALKELTEAHLLFAILTNSPLPSPKTLEVPPAAYLNGLAEAATELRRFALDLIRQDQAAAAEPYLAAMDDIYSLLITIDFPDAITGGLRRATDVVRGVLERTRGDLTLAIRQDQMRTALREFGGRIGVEFEVANGIAQQEEEEAV